MGLKLAYRLMDISWKQIVKYSTLPLVPGVVLIITTTGEPRLSFTTGISSALALIVFISIGFSIADDLTERFKYTLLYLFAGLGVVPFIMLFRVLEIPAEGIMTIQNAVIIVLVCVVLGLVWLVLSRNVFRSFCPKQIQIIKGALAESYIGLPMLYYFLATPKGIPFITSSGNFFPDHLGIRIITWILLTGVVILAGKMASWTTLPSIIRR